MRRSRGGGTGVAEGRAGPTGAGLRDRSAEAGDAPGPAIRLALGPLSYIYMPRARSASEGGRLTRTPSAALGDTIMARRPWGGAMDDDVIPGYFANRSVLVTGAAGFLGTHLCARLHGLGAHVVGVDNFSFARPDRDAVATGVTLETVDIRDPTATRAILERTRPEVIFHLAAIANPRTCKQDFPLAFDVNVLGTQNVLRFAPPSARTLFMSSAAVYGAPERLPIDETHPRNGADPYSVTKIMGEDLVGCYGRQFGRDVAIVRNFNSFGVGQTGDYIVPQLIRQALTEKKIEIWDARTVRDLMYIDNTLEALLVVVARGEKGPVNIGAGRGITVGELAQTIADRLGGSIPIVDLKKAVVGSPALVSNNDRIRGLGWTEAISFGDGIERTIAWTRGQLAGTGA